MTANLAVGHHTEESGKTTGISCIPQACQLGLLCSVKFTEHMIHSQLYFLAETRSWLCPVQASFRASRSCEDQNLQVPQTINGEYQAARPKRTVQGAVVGVIEASALKAYPSASTLSGSVVRTLRGGEELSNIFCLVATSVGHLRSQCSIICSSSLQRGHNGSMNGSSRLV